jgi:hypothetical protein
VIHDQHDDTINSLYICSILLHPHSVEELFAKQTRHGRRPCEKHLRERSMAATYLAGQGAEGAVRLAVGAAHDLNHLLAQLHGRREGLRVPPFTFTTSHTDSKACQWMQACMTSAAEAQS